MRAYLAEFLADPKVVELPRLLWLPILHGIVLNTRPRRSAHKYAAIWTPEGSPLAVHTLRQTELLRKTGMPVEYAMRYGQPSIASVLAKFNPSKILPLYPQYSESTTGSVIDLLPGKRIVRDFHDHPAYIGALAAGVQRHWAANGRAEKLVISFHGLPQRAVERGDPYQTQCFKTASLLAEELRIEDKDYLVAFQSRFGAAQWLQPYTQPLLEEMARGGVRDVDLVCPGFVSDCLETLEEIDIVARRAFLAAGGRRFAYVPCLNEAPEWIEALRVICRAAP